MTINGEGPDDAGDQATTPSALRRRTRAAARAEDADELWFYPDGSRILELSTKCAPTEGFQVAAETRAFLSSQGVDLLGEQQTKTKTALEYFSRNLDAAATA